MGAANELITRGWNQGDIEGPDGSVCYVGAIRYALGLPKWSRLPEGVQVAATAACGSEFWGAWNDDRRRTRDEVLRAAKNFDETYDPAVRYLSDYEPSI